MRKIICALIIAGMVFVLGACNGEHRVNIKDGAVILTDVGLKVVLPKGWVVFDTEEAWGRGRTVQWNDTQYFTFQYYTLYPETDANEPFWESRFLMSAEKPNGGIAMVLGIGAIPENMDAESLARRINDFALMAFGERNFSSDGTVESFSEADSDNPAIRGFLSTVKVAFPDGETDYEFTIADYVFTYKDNMYCMEIYSDESADKEDTKNIQIIPAG